MSEEIEIHIIICPKGTIVSSSAKSLDDALTQYVTDWVPYAIRDTVHMGSAHSHGLLYIYWSAMTQAGFKHTIRWVEL